MKIQKRLLKHVIFYSIISFMILPHCVNGQEPSFTQFISSPLSINPALIGSADEDWRFSSIIKRQWIGNTSPLSTQNISFDGRIKNVNENNYFGLGGYVVAENTMGGFFRTDYINLSTSYHQSLDDNGNGLSLGLGFIRGSNRIDYSQMTFDQQITNAGFINSLPTNEMNLGNKTSFNSACMGITYNYDTEDSYLDVGVSAYQFIHSKRTLLNAIDQRINSKYNLYAEYGASINDFINANLHAMYSYQTGLNYLTMSANFGFLLGNTTSTEDAFNMINTGIIYRMNSVVAPMMGYVYKNLQFAISYDLNISATKGTAAVYKNAELSFKYKKYLPTYRRKPGRFNSPF